MSVSTPRQFIEAPSPLVAQPGTFPGVPMPSGKWALYAPATGNVFTKEEVERMKGKCQSEGLFRKSRVRVAVIDPTLPPNDDPITIVNWWPGNTGYKEDKVMGRIIVVGRYLDPEESCLGVGLAEAKAKLHARRVAVLVRSLHKGVTKGFSVGASGAGSRITEPASGNDAIAVAGGGLIGRTTVEDQDRLEFMILALNDGPVEPPPVTPAQVLPPQPPPPQVVKIEVEVKTPPAPTTPPPAPAPAPTSTQLCADIPQVTVQFALDRAEVRNQELPKIEQMAEWLGSHPGCPVQVQGHTCLAGSFDHNTLLGRRRAKSVYDLLVQRLVARGVDPARVKDFASESKDFPKIKGSEWQEQNRRVIFVVQGPASGK